MVSFRRAIPQPLRGVFDSARNVASGQGSVNIPGFNSAAPPSKAGFGTRQSRIASGRTARFTRNLVRFFVPETGIVEMYINPQQIRDTKKKDISQVRTKNGFVLQYWGEALGQIALEGTTGSSGVEGINVLDDVYRNEQVSFDPYALALAASRDQAALSDSIADRLTGNFGDILGSVGSGLLGVAGQGLGGSFIDQVSSTLETGASNPTRPKPTLASLAFQVEMYWSGWVYRGYFTDFSVTESANEIGLFNYSLNFTYTQKRGIRLNFFPWHRSAVDGPSDSTPDYRGGVPYSFSRLDGFPLPLTPDPNTITNTQNLLGSNRPLAGDR